MSRLVLDASAVLALLLEEPGADHVASERGRAAMTTVNACEVIERLAANGLSPARALQMLGALELDMADFTLELAAVAARLKAETRAAGLSLGDRACLALALRENVPVLTADREWAKVNIGVEIRLIR